MIGQTLPVNGSGSKTLTCRCCQFLPDLVRHEGCCDVIRCPVCGVFGAEEEVIATALKKISRGDLDAFRDRIVRSVSRSKNFRYIRDSQPDLPEPDFIFTIHLCNTTHLDRPRERNRPQ